ncbi:MAG: UDP-N-acetylmuramoyl-tripeptide--D-alanyl-D-alanine ligase [Bacteroidales bacterium]|nr:UDP-N-acetylmuramoyl-tripeptide--D-alanyl-D-alanine ligase [Bacteroidales bacterium]
MCSFLYEKYRECGYRVTTDSRSLTGGEIFFALRGENFDGNVFALSALEKGAALAVVNDDAGLGDDPRLYPVPDPFTALRDLAIEHRENLSIPVVGLTGTNGKTTTKELIAAVLSRRFKVTATKGNLNNDIGVPLSVLTITPETEIAVIEMGASHPDDIAKLVPVSQPGFGLITNVGKAHLLGFGSFEGVKAAKGELYKWLGAHAGSTIFLNEDDSDLKAMADAQPCEQIGYGIDCQGVELIPSTPDEPFLRLRLDGKLIRTQLVGAYNATNVLAAIAVGRYFGVPEDDAISAISGYEPTNKRSQMVKTGRNTLIVDAYNANPSSMSAALDNFSHVEAPVKLALLGDMRELGADSLKEHAKIVWKLCSEGIDAYLVGNEFRGALAQLGIDPCSGETCICGCFDDSDALAAFLEENPVNGAMVLVKGSRGIQMEKTISKL